MDEPKLTTLEQARQAVAGATANPLGRLEKPYLLTGLAQAEALTRLADAAELAVRYFMEIPHADD